MERTKIGIIGCGNISGIYCKNGSTFHNIEIAACADLDLERAKAKAAEYNIPKALCVDELLADPEIEIVINLTIPAAHAAISRQAIKAGKHVHGEKPLAINREDGAALQKLAREKNLRTGCAPDTFLGAGLQTCRKLLDEGVIGGPIGVAGWMLSHGPENWHPDPEFFYQPGAGQKTFEEVPLAFPYAENSRGSGVAGMAAAIRAGHPHRASGDMAFHVLDVMVSVHDASREGRHVQFPKSPL